MGMNWIHLSDLHYAPGALHYDTDIMLEKLHKYITGERIIAEELFFTGDFRYAPDPGGVSPKQAADELREIARLVGGAIPARIHITPGNHDFDRLEEASKNDNKTPMLTLAKKLYDGGEFKGELPLPGGAVKCEKYLLDRFTFYREAAKELKDPIWTDDAEIHHCRLYGGLKILYMNTAVACGRDDERGDLKLGYNDLYKTLSKYPKEIPGVALGHHGLMNFNSIERNRIIDIFNNYNIKLYLCGDAHIGDDISINMLPQITSGCLKLDNGVEPVFFTGEFRDNGDIVVKAHKYDLNHPGWGYSKPFSDSIAEKLPKIKDKTYYFANKRKIFGRDEIIEKVIDTIRNGRASTIEVYGVAGVGKTTVCQTALAHAGVDHIKVDAREYGNMRSIALFVTRVSPRAFACDAINVSLSPIGVPARFCFACIRPYSAAASVSKGTVSIIAKLGISH